MEFTSFFALDWGTNFTMQLNDQIVPWNRNITIQSSAGLQDKNNRIFFLEWNVITNKQGISWLISFG